MTRNSRPRIAIVGGGLAGLAAATRAARAGAAVTLFERASRAGGRAQTRDEEGFRFNLGPHALYPRAAALLRDLGVEIPGSSPKVGGGLALYRGRNHRLPGSAGSALRTGLLNPADKVALATSLAAIYRADPAALAAVTVADYLSELTARPRVREVLAAYLRLATYVHAPDRLSMGAAIQQLRGAGVRYIDGGWETLIDGLAAAAWDAGATLHVTRRVEGVAPSDGGVRLMLAEGATQEFDSAILTGGPGDVARLLPGPAANDFHNATAELQPVRAAVLDLGLRKLPNPRVTFGLGIDEPLYLSVHSEWAKLAPEGGATVHLARYLAPGEGTGAEELRDQLEAWADRAQPGWREQCVVRRFMPALTVTHALVDAAAGGFAGRPTIDATGIPGVYIAGDWVGDDGMLADASLASGISAASAAVTSRARMQEAVRA